MMGTPAAFRRQREVERRLSAELHDHADWGSACGFMLVDREHVFEGERLEVEAVAGVVVGGDGLGIAIDHDRLVAVVAQRERSVAAAVVELDSLPDAIGPAAQDDDLLAIGGRGLVFFFVGRVQVRREALELGGAGVDALVDGAYAVLLAQAGESSRSSLALVGLSELPSAAVGEAEALELAQRGGANGLRAEAAAAWPARRQFP